jgi:hypothetical protein
MLVVDWARAETSPDNKAIVIIKTRIALYRPWFPKLVAMSLIGSLSGDDPEFTTFERENEAKTNARIKKVVACVIWIYARR